MLGYEWCGGLKEGRRARCGRRTRKRDGGYRGKREGRDGVGEDKDGVLCGGLVGGSGTRWWERGWTRLGLGQGPRYRRGLAQEGCDSNRGAERRERGERERE